MLYWLLVVRLRPGHRGVSRPHGAGRGRVGDRALVAVGLIGDAIGKFWRAWKLA
ncbi:hypothetical protein HBB16_15185 [Pseudonocardia sp. MCCB 268]|nr:hypothetical protein [Pseudonocardia cytotoxica]